MSSGASIQQLPPGSSGSNTKIVAVKNKVSIETSTNGLENQLLIRNAAPATDAGNYTCVPAGAEPASIVVHVLNGMLPPELIIYYLYASLYSDASFLGAVWNFNIETCHRLPAAAFQLLFFSVYSIELVFLSMNN